MQLSDFKLFLHLVESKNFSHSAKQNHMSPSTLSRQIQRIEQEIGQPLFYRDNRQVSLTTAGEQFLPFAQQQWQQWLNFKQQLQHQADELTGELRLFCSVTAAYSHLPTILTKFRARYPKVEIQLTTGDPAAAAQLVQQQQVDLALAGRPNNIPSNLLFKYIDEITLSLIAPRIACPTNQLLKQTPVNWQQIPFILPVEGPARQRIEQWFKHKEIKYPKIYASVAGHEGIVSMVAVGCGVAMVPDVVIDNSPLNSQISRLNLDIPIEPFALGICTQKRTLEQPLARAFWQLLA